MLRLKVLTALLACMFAMPVLAADLDAPPVDVQAPPVAVEPAPPVCAKWAVTSPYGYVNMQAYPTSQSELVGRVLNGGVVVYCGLGAVDEGGQPWLWVQFFPPEEPWEHEAWVAQWFVTPLIAPREMAPPPVVVAPASPPVVNNYYYQVVPPYPQEETQQPPPPPYYHQAYPCAVSNRPCVVPDGHGGYVPFTNSRVMPDGGLRPYDPYVDGFPYPPY
jgi:hypothetical protein